MDRKSESALLRSAQRARASAARFAAIVDRFGAEMPGHIDRLHEALSDIRQVAVSLEHGPSLRPSALSAQAVSPADRSYGYQMAAE